MKRTYVVVLVVGLLLSLGVPVAGALTNSLGVPEAPVLTINQKADLEALYEEQHQLKQRILEKQVEFGLVTPADAEQFRSRMQERWERRTQKMAEGDYSFGLGKGGSCGRRGGWGRSPAGETPIQ